MYPKLVEIFFLYIRTIRFLRAKQIFYRIWKLRPKIVKPLTVIPKERPTARCFCSPIVKRSCLIGDFDFFFLNVRQKISKSGGWSNVGDGPLWRYNLHYFDCLSTEASDTNDALRLWQKNFIRIWLASQPFGTPVSWDAYPTSLRLVNWIKYHHCVEQLSAEMRDSLAQQAFWLSKNIEWHLGGNHVFANAKALVFAGCFFDDKLSEKWLQKGLSILARELDEQVLQDGGHFELSVMYQAIIIEDILDLISLLNTYDVNDLDALRNKLVTKAHAMIGWLEIMCHPDGDISYFNDSTMGIAPKLNDLRAYAKRLFVQPEKKVFERLNKLTDSGYYRAEIGPFSLLADMASIGAKYIPGHGHADALSFELSIFGFRSIVNSGVSTYNKEPFREKERGTSMHSTVCVENQNSSETWSVFRVARRAEVSDLRTELGSDYVNLSASHDGYSRIWSGLRHCREWYCDKSKIIIKDQVNSNSLVAVSRFIFHPQLEFVRESSDEVVFKFANGQRVLFSAKGLVLGQTTFSFGFNKRRKTSEILVPVKNGVARTTLSILDSNE